MIREGEIKKRLHVSLKMLSPLMVNVHICGID